MPKHYRYDALLQQHRRIERSLATELQRPLPDSLTIQRLKRRKLLVKDEIQAWERLLAAMGHGAAPGGVPGAMPEGDGLRA